ncbi:unnamed protein product [Alopecurus aequalis]
MGVGMKHAREEEPVSLTTDSPTTSAGAVSTKKRVRRGRVVATSGEGEFVCKTCGRAFTSFQALGGHRTSHLRGSHGLELGGGVAKAIRDRKRLEDKDKRHECHICGLGFEMGQALGGHMRRHREEMALSGAGDGADDDQWVWRSVGMPGHVVAGHAAADRPPVLLELFV